MTGLNFLGARFRHHRDLPQEPNKTFILFMNGAVSDVSLRREEGRQMLLLRCYDERNSQGRNGRQQEVPIS